MTNKRPTRILTLPKVSTACSIQPRSGALGTALVESPVAYSLTLRGSGSSRHGAYRDYVIEALNGLQFDHFLRAQVSGDLLRPIRWPRDTTAPRRHHSAHARPHSNLEERTMKQLRMDLVTNSSTSIGRRLSRQTITCAPRTITSSIPIPTSRDY